VIVAIDWNPINWVTDRIAGLVDTVRDAALDKVLDGLVGWVTDAFSMLIAQILDLVRDTATPNVLDTIGHDRQLWNLTVGFAALMLLGFVLAATLQGLLAGSVLSTVRRLATTLPGAVLAMVALPTVTQSGLAFTDEAVKGLLQSDAKNLESIFAGLTTSSAIAGGGFITFVLGVIGVGAAIVVWLELYARAALIHVVVAVSPIAFACLVWPALRITARKLIYCLVSLVFCKLLIAIVIRVGASVATSVDLSGEGVHQSIGRFITGMFILVLAAFAPYGLMRMLPFAEGAIVASGATSVARGLGTPIGSVTGTLTRLSPSTLAGSDGSFSGSDAASGTPHESSAGVTSAAAGPGASGAAGGGSSAGGVARGAASGATSAAPAVLPLAIAMAGVQMGNQARQSASDAGTAMVRGPRSTVDDVPVSGARGS